MTVHSFSTQYNTEQLSRYSHSALNRFWPCPRLTKTGHSHISCV